MKTTALALALLLGATSLASAAPYVVPQEASFDADFYTAQLEYEGIDVISVDDYWLDTFKATVRDENGNTVFRFFDKGSLKQVIFGR